MRLDLTDKAPYFKNWSKKTVPELTYAGTTATKRIMQGKSKHFNTYTCDNYKNGICKGLIVK